MKISMKKLIYLLAFMTLAFASCDKDDPSKPDKPPQPPPEPVDTTWFSLKIEVDIGYQATRWDCQSVHIGFYEEETGSSQLEYFVEQGNYLEYVEKEWRYEEDKARNHIDKKRYVSARASYVIPGTYYIKRVEEWKMLEIKEGENVMKFELMSPI
jgi:hypothetical protein